MDAPFYAAYPWPLNDIYTFWDNYFAQMNTQCTLAYLKIWFSPYEMMARNADFSDFGRA